MPGGFLVISLDFELLWGVRDHETRESYGPSILGGRAAIPRILDCFARYKVAATWATVGFLFCEDRDDLMQHLPDVARRPKYKKTALSNYTYLDEVGTDERQDPYYFGASLIDRIAQTPRQEIATHTLSHFYSLEPGSTIDAFRADLEIATALAERRKIELASIVFPRNQYSETHLSVVSDLGLSVYRGNPKGWAYKPVEGSGETLLRRAARLADAHSGVLGHHTYKPSEKAPVNDPDSRFLRPCIGKLGRIHPFHIRTIERGMRTAAKEGSAFQLWWHPHNFGLNMEANLQALERILRTYKRLEAEYGMRSRTMREAAVFQ